MSSKRSRITMVVIALLILGLGMLGFNYFLNSLQHKRAGLTIDCARIYYRPQTIKKYINIVSKEHGDYVKLHVSDNENFALESKTLGQTVSNAVKRNGTYYNKSTNQPFWSKKEFKELIDYGRQKHVSIVPEIDVPAHSQAILKLLNDSHQTTLLNQIKFNDTQLNFHKVQTLEFVKHLYAEYTGILPKNSYFATGGDELVVGSGYQNESDLANFDNQLDDYLNGKNLKMIVYNDSIHKKVLNLYRKNILVTFWSLGGEIANKDNYNYNVANRATMPEINRAGLKTVNANGYYTYLVIKPKLFTKQSIDYWKQDLHKWNPKVWDEDNLDQVASNKKHMIIGSTLSIWGEKDVMSGQQVYEKTKDLVKYYFKYVNNSYRE